MEDRFSQKRAFLLILAAFGFVLLLSPGRAQDRTVRIGPPGRAAAAAAQASRPDLQDDEGGLRRLAAQLRYYRAAGDLENAAKIFAKMFSTDPEAEIYAAKAGTPTGSNRIEGVPGNIKEPAVPAGTSPVFFSPEAERSPGALLGRSSRGPGSLFAVAEQWSGGRPQDLRVRKSTDRGRTWDETVVLGDGRAWTAPSLSQGADGMVGLAFVRDWDGVEADIFFARLADDLASSAVVPVAAGPADQRSPALASDFPRFRSGYLYVLFTERTALGRSVELKVSPDLGATWTGSITVASFPGAGGPEIETALAYDPDRNVLHAAFIGPQGNSTGVAVATSTTFGASWSVPVFVTPRDGGAARRPRIAAGRGQAVLVYERGAGSGDTDIGLAASANGGLIWTTGAFLAASSAAETFPDVRAESGSAPFRFIASFVESGSRVKVLSREAAATSAWTAETTVAAGAGGVSSGPVVLLPLPSSGGRASAGVLWTSGSPDSDILFGPITVLAADLTVTPANQDVTAAAGTTDFAVTRTGQDDVAWTAAVTSGSSWLSIQSGSSGTNDGTIVAAYDANPGTASRVGTIQVTPADVSIPSPTVTVTQAGEPGLEVTPADNFVSSGPPGGPFVPASKDYMLRNTSGTALSWTAGDNRTWINLSRTSGSLNPGASDVVTVFFTSTADNLGPGLHLGTVTFTNRTTGVGNTTREVQLTVTATPGTLSVSPAEGLASTGPPGGPFTPVSQAYQLQNTGGASIDWTAARTQAWTTLSAVSGALGPGESTTVTVSINDAAASLPSGTHDDTVTFANTTNGSGDTTRPVALTVTPPPGVLTVTPAGGLVSSGPEGGPFAPVSQAYQLQNTGGASIGWTAAKTAAWTTLSAVSGALGAGESATVTVSIDAAADALGLGTYTDTVTFANATNGSGDTTRPVTLTVTPPPGVLTVTPAGGLASSGLEGGPFTPASQSYTLQNTGQSELAWSASKTRSWTSLSAASGTLAVGATATVTVSINSAANSLGAGNYADTVSFINTTTGTGDTTRPVALTVQPGPALSVTPANREVPFTGGTATFDVANTGGGTLIWTASAISGSDWLTISSGGSGTNAGTITVQAAANRTQIERTGTIRVTAPGASGSPATVTVSQVKGSLSLSLSGVRLVERAWTVEREFARLTVTIDNPAAIPVESFVFYRRAAGGAEQIVRQVDGATVSGAILVINDAFLDAGVSYTYRVAAVDVFGNTLAASNEIIIP